MKALRQVCAAFALTLILSLSAFAGDITTGIAAPPPPSQQATTQGEISTGIAGDITTGITATNPVTETVLNLLLNVLALF